MGSSFLVSESVSIVPSSIKSGTHYRPQGTLANSPPCNALLGILKSVLRTATSSFVCVGLSLVPTLCVRWQSRISPFTVILTWLLEAPYSSCLTPVAASTQLLNVPPGERPQAKQECKQILCESEDPHDAWF